MRCSMQLRAAFTTQPSRARYVMTLWEMSLETGRLLFDFGCPSPQMEKLFVPWSERAIALASTALRVARQGQKGRRENIENKIID